VLPTPFSIDFGVVHLEDVVAKRGAPPGDEACTGTTMRDYLRGTDFSHIADEVVALYTDGTGSRGDLLYQQRD